MGHVASWGFVGHAPVRCCEELVCDIWQVGGTLVTGEAGELTGSRRGIKLLWTRTSENLQGSRVRFLLPGVRVGTLDCRFFTVLPSVKHTNTLELLTFRGKTSFLITNVNDSFHHNEYQTTHYASPVSWVAETLPLELT